ncbi:MAG: isoleucine--tRNA ligase [Magnetococcales bacterium]|nr:isoleucine--tRNA ligase [Magnetococcales bacterium]
MEYKDTIHLPKTKFPMRAGLPKKEPNILTLWQEMDLFSLMREDAKGREKFILHDGPPYANGHLHMGHAVNKVLKDVIVKAKQMMGYDANYVPGWDCHGLPIETKVEQELKKEGRSKETVSAVEFRTRCREFAARWVDIQRDEFIRLGGVGDWHNPYLTMDYRFESDIVRELNKFQINGGLYKGFKPVYWCSNDVTALAEAEVEYDDHTSTSIYVKFPLAEDESLADVDAALADQPVSVVIWTTTPWTIPANMAVCLNGGYFYSAVRIDDPADNANLKAGEILILAEPMWQDVMEALGVAEESCTVVARFYGEKLERKQFRHPYLDQNAMILLGDHVTLEAGTGCVHTAPGHGQEDYEVGMLYGVKAFNPVDDHGRFVEGTPHFAGLEVNEANPKVVAFLDEQGKLLAQGSIKHSYPHCWRCHRPLITRATPQWFISMEKNELRDKALDQIKQTKWIPNWGKDRIYNMVVNRPDWCVSRQRNWGVPITVLTCEKCGESVKDPQILDGIADAVEKEGADVWFVRDASGFLPEGHTCGCGSTEFVKETDILDVWFDSGVTHAAVLQRREGLAWPADLYLEGSDQHRGWFHSSLLASVGTHDVAPYKAVLTHGFVVDGKGHKMSKSKGNVIPPEKVIKQYGADILRMWVTAEDYADDIRISGEILKGLSDSYRRIRNTIRYFLGNLVDYDHETNAVSLDQMEEIDRWALDRIANMIESVETAYETYRFHRVYQDLHYFCAVEMGAFYLDIIKDRLYCESEPKRRAAQTVLHHALDALVRLMAPILSFTAEEVWQLMPGEKAQSVLLSSFPKPHPEWRNDVLNTRWDRYREVRTEVYRILEKERNEKRIGSFMESIVTLYADDDLAEFLNSFEDQFRLFIVADVQVKPLAEAPQDAIIPDDVKGLKITTAKAESGKCARCWNRDPKVGSFEDHPELCSRCHDVVIAEVG